MIPVSLMFSQENTVILWTRLTVYEHCVASSLNIEVEPHYHSKVEEQPSWNFRHLQPVQSLSVVELKNELVVDSELVEDPSAAAEEECKEYHQEESCI